jgi:hypothetical protein
LTRHTFGDPHRDNIERLVTSRGVSRSDPADVWVGIVKVQPSACSRRQTRCADVNNTSIAADAKPRVHPRSRFGDFPVADMEDGQPSVPLRVRRSARHPLRYPYGDDIKGLVGIRRFGVASGSLRCKAAAATL